MLLQLQGYDITITHERGKDVVCGHAVLGAITEQNQHRSSTAASRSSHGTLMHRLRRSLAQHLPISKAKIAEIQVATDQDESLRKGLVKRWMENKSQIPPDVMPYFTLRNELVLQNGVLYQGERIVIPMAIRRHSDTNSFLP